ncbi:M15 family metallopeptidase [Nocardioides halotolerans]|uniref:M15 family metallopeptidase n=1 Tax=Nocardioides halotolerans TaxID=433660 RepID=UPI00146E89FB|nr:M15 family metallopeptidase [Nocardioides halotolerans]
MRKTLVAVSVGACVVAIGGPVWLGRTPDAPVGAAADPRPIHVTEVPQTAPPAAATTRPPFDRGARSTTDPTSIWVVVNKTHPITPSDFRPELDIVRGYQVAPPAARPLGRLLDASDRRGLGLKIASAFRSYGYQQGVHAATAAARGEAEADLRSARAGYSEHQTGLAVDLITPDDPGCDFEACFARTPAGRWLARNAWRWGFVVRYQPDTTAITGYQPEPWHLRYVGRPLARELRVTDVRTLEEFFGVAGGDYPS